MRINIYPSRKGSSSISKVLRSQKKRSSIVSNKRRELLSWSISDLSLMSFLKPALERRKVASPSRTRLCCYDVLMIARHSLLYLFY